MYNILQLHGELKTQTYTHGGYCHFRVSDPKPRDIHKASVRDRLLHHALYRVLYPSFDTIFIYDSYSCRVGKGTHKAIDRFRSFVYTVSRNHTRTAWVLKCDIKKFFASIDHAALLRIVADRVADARIVALLREIVGSFSAAPGKGLPLGNLTSQLLVNVYMNEFDQYVKQTLKIPYYVRYADDFVLLSHDRGQLAHVLSQLRAFLRERLQLELHPHKVFIKTVASGADFLGWIQFPDHRVLRTASKRRMLRRLCERAGSEGEEATKESYRSMLGHGNAYKLRQKI